MFLNQFYPFKDFQFDQIQRSPCKIFTAHYACRNTDLNLTSVTGTINGFIFQIINSLIEFWGVCLTCLDRKKITKIKMFNNLFPRVHSLTVFCKVNTLELTLEITCSDTYWTVQSVTTIDIQNSDVLYEALWGIKILREGICKQSFSFLSVLSEGSSTGLIAWLQLWLYV